MDVILIKILATALTLSQVATSPDDLKTRFESQDKPQVVSLLRAGCAQMRKTFDVEDLNVDDLIATAMDDPEAIAGGHAAFRGIDIGSLHKVYRQFCKNEAVAESPVDVDAVIDFYNRTLSDLPDHTRLKGMKLPGASVVLDRKGGRIAEVFEQDHRRVWVPLADIPAHVQQAFVAAEDKRFYQHKGIDERAVIRAFIGNLTQSGRPQGGSTITQQVVKNLLVGDDVTYERKMREMILASRIEHTLTKSEILELYLNSTFLGRGSWGVEMAARSYFGTPVSALSIGEAALLAGLTKGPNYYNPERHPARAKERYSYVLGRMQEDGAITAEEAKQASFPDLAPYDGNRTLAGSYFADQVAREIRITGDRAFRLDSYQIRSTLDPEMQRAAEVALQDGLARYEMNANRVEFHGPEANLAEAIGRIDAAGAAPMDKPAPKASWQQALEATRLPLHDVHWQTAVVIDAAGAANRKRGDGAIRVGLADGRVLPLQGQGAILRRLKLHDVVLVRLAEGKGKTARAELRVRPVVQGATVVIENKTGRVLAMVGGFSYGLSQLNRVTQAQRQPGSALKPLSYLAALQKGLQPNTLVRDEPITLAPINGGKRAEDYWTPKNYDGGSSGIMTLRSALENSRNLATVNLLEGGIAATAPQSLDRVCALAVDIQIYKECVHYYPFVLGAQPVRPIDLAGFYAAIATEGARPLPYTIDAIERNGEIVYRHAPAPVRISAADRASFYQLKTMLQGVLQRGTARAIGGLAPYVAGKTGTSDDENDVWFVGFTNDVTVAVWVGYDNADGKRRTLGGGNTGGSVAVPIFEPIIQAVWAHHAPRTPLDPPSAEAKALLVTASGEDRRRRGKGSVEYLRRDAKGRAVDARYSLVSRRDEGPRETPQAPRVRRQYVAPQPDSQARAQQAPWGWNHGWGNQGGWQDQHRGFGFGNPYERRDNGFFRN